jgi:selenide,water dikinase
MSVSPRSSRPAAALASSPPTIWSRSCGTWRRLHTPGSIRTSDRWRTRRCCDRQGGGLVFTVDFITPIVDDPETFGAIAAANAISDVYAMGGEPQVALAVCGFSSDLLPLSVLERIFRGGRDKAAEAGCAVVGGHTIKDGELKYGLCVLGTVDPARALTQTQARPGDALVLTKPLGFGIASQAIKKQALPPAQLAEVTRLMMTLNKSAKDAALAAGARAATDVTGFGLLRHLHNLLSGSGVAARLRADAVPVLPFARALAADGLVPGGSRANLAAAAPYCRWDDGVAELDRLLLADAQTSGGLLIAVPAAPRRRDDRRPRRPRRPGPRSHRRDHRGNAGEIAVER